jgi:hypothetical protein
MRIYLLTITLLCSVSVWAQPKDSIPLKPVAVVADSTDNVADETDSTDVPERGFIGRFFSKNYPDPRKAALFAIIPGGGQIYNKRWWKLPLVYGGLGTFYYFEKYNLNQYNTVRVKYRDKADLNPNNDPTDYPYNVVDLTTLKNYRDQLRRYVEQTSLWFAIFYLATITDAFVDAHLARFDVSDDLTMRILPKLQTDSFGPAFGLGFQIQIGRHSEIQPRHFNFGPNIVPPQP